MATQGFDIRAARASIGMTQGKLADAIGLSQGFIGEMERGEKPVELRTELAVRYIVEREQRAREQPVESRTAAAFAGQGELATMNVASLWPLIEKRYPQLRG